MSEFLFVGGPLHGRVLDIYSNENIVPEGSMNLRVTMDGDVVQYKRSSFSYCNGLNYRVAVAEGASELIPQTIEEENYQPL